MKVSDEDIFTTLYVPQYKRLFSVAAAILGNRDEAADAVQDTMVRIWNNRATLPSIKSPEAYALTALRSTAIDIIRRRHPAVEIESVRDLAEHDTPRDVDTSEILSRIIDTLPSAQQEVIRLNAFDDRSPAEIAQLTGHSPENVRQLLSRGRRKIKELYLKLTQQ